MENAAVCSYCQAPLAAEDVRETCTSCHAVYHEECWRENNGCAVYGCTATPAPQPRSEVETPVSWWGRVNKPCPSCGKEILAAAVRCRHCGATFSSARPEDVAEFQRRSQLEELKPALRKKVIWQFVLSAIPFTSPVGAIMGYAWFLPNRAEIEKLPPIFPALGKLGLIIGSIQLVAFVVLTVLYATFR